MDTSDDAHEINELINYKIQNDINTAFLARVTHVEKNRVNIQNIISDSTDLECPIINNVLIGQYYTSHFSIHAPVEVGDIGLAIVCKQDISNYRYTGQPGQKNSSRLFDITDSVFIPLSLYKQDEHEKKEVLIKTKDDKNVIKITDDKITISDRDGKSTIDISGDDIIIKSSKVDIKGDDINLKASNINIETTLGSYKDVFNDIIKLLDSLSQGMLGSGTNNAAYMALAPAIKQKINTILG